MFTTYFLYKDSITNIQNLSITDMITELKSLSNKHPDISIYCHWDIELLSLGENYTYIGDVAPKGLVNAYEWDNGCKYPDIDNFETSRVPFYSECVNHHCSHIIKSKYLNYLIDYAPKGHSYLSKTLQSLYVLSINSYNELNFTKYTSRICELSIRFNDTESIKKAIRLLKSKIKAYCYVKSDFHPYIYYFLYRKLTFIKKANNENLDNITDTVLEASAILDILYKRNDFLQVENMLKELISIYKCLADEKEVNLLYSQMIIACENEGNYYSSQNKYFSAANCYEKAIQIGINQGILERVEFLKAKLKNEYKKAGSSIEPKTFNLPIENYISMENEIMQFITGYPQHDFRNFIAFMLANILDNKKNLYPSLNISYNNAKHRTLNPIWQITGIVKMQDNRKIAEAKSPEDNITLLAYDDFGTHLQLLCVILVIPIFERLYQEGLSNDFILDQIYGCQYLSETDKEIFNVVVRHLLSEDYISFLHLALPLSERIFRKQFEYHNFGTTTIKNHTTQHEQTFNEFLSTKKVTENIPKILLDVITFSLVDNKGLNLRNNIAHGLCDLSDFNKTNSYIIFLILLLIVRFDWIEYCC